MIVPPSPTLQASNPKFARLYTHIVTTFLNPDGSLRPSTTEANIQAQIAHSLQNLQTHAAEFTLLKHALFSLLGTSPSTLTDAQKDLILLLCSPSSPPLDPSPADLCNDKKLTAQISQHLVETATTFSSLPQPNPQTLTTLSARLLTSHLALADTAAELSALHRDICATAVGILEGAKLGAVGRAVDARALYLRRVAEGMAWKARVKGLEAQDAVYDVEVLGALGNYQRHMEGYRASLEARVRSAEEWLEAYQEAGGRAMGAIAGQMGRLGEEVRVVRGEMERLGETGIGG